MTVDEPVPLSDLLSAATTALRQHTDAGWTRVRGSVLAASLAAFRPSAPVRGSHAGGDFYVASDVLASRVRTVVDALRAAAAARVVTTTDEADELQRLLVEVVAAYGSPLLALASRVREVVAVEVTAVLGARPAPGVITVDVHVGDVTDDPRML